MKKIRLVDVDAIADKKRKKKRRRYSNIALMKISAWHKQQGDQVSWDEPNPDIIYASIIFTENKDSLYFLQNDFPNAEIHIGGSGYSFDVLPDEIDMMMPDYSIYEGKYNIGFSTRGCNRKCPYCIVYMKEGKIRKYMEIKQFHNPKNKNIVLLDNNILALKGWFKKNMAYVKKHNLKVDFNQGLDIRLINQEVLDILKGIRFQELRFAWDTMDISKTVKEKLKLIEKNFVELKHNCSFYVLVEHDTNIVDDLERVHYLRMKGIPSYIMPYQKIYKGQSEPIRQKHTKSLERYCNKRDFYFKYLTYWDFLREEYSLNYYLKILGEWKKLVGEKC